MENLCVIILNNCVDIFSTKRLPGRSITAGRDTAVNCFDVSDNDNTTLLIPFGFQIYVELLDKSCTISDLLSLKHSMYT